MREHFQKTGLLMEQTTSHFFNEIRDFAKCHYIKIYFALIIFI